MEAVKAIGCRFELELLLCVVLLATLLAQPALADAQEDHLARYHEGFATETSDKELDRARLALLGYSAKQGLKAAGVDYRQTKQLLKRALIHSLTPQTRVIVLPSRLNLQTHYYDGEVMTELSGKADGEVALKLKFAF